MPARDPRESPATGSGVPAPTPGSTGEGGGSGGEGASSTADWTAELGGIRVRFGHGTLTELGEAARELGCRRPLVVTDPGLEAAGHADRALASLSAAGLQPALFDGVEANPTTASVEAGRERAREHGADLLVGLGGGSAMDVAKGVNFLFTNGGSMEDYWGSGRASRPMLPGIGVPTTAGTGSEAQSFALIAKADTHRKMACGDPKARFRVVLLDPELLATTPRPVAAAAGIDALSHAVESYVTLRRNPVSAMLAREAWKHLEASFEASLGEPADLEARGRMLLGAHLAGAAIELSMLGAAHALANPLTARHGVAHGVAVGLMLPHVVRFNGESAGARYAELAHAGPAPAGPVAAADALAVRLESLRAAAGLPARLRDLDIERASLSRLARLATREWTGGFNPRPVGEEELLALYEEAY